MDSGLSTEYPYKEVQVLRRGVGTQGSGQGCEALASQPRPTATRPKQRLAIASALGLCKPGSGSVQLLFCDHPRIARFPLDFLVARADVLGNNLVFAG